MTETPTFTEKSRGEQTAAAEATRGGPYFTPRVDIYETDKELLLFADVPGARPDDVGLRFERGELLLHARVQGRHHGGHVLLEEYEEGDFYRVFQIHESIDSTRIEAECKNGVLTVHLAKAESAQPRKVNVRGA
jgi:HSP20 family molecular chaperone IbpA